MCPRRPESTRHWHPEALVVEKKEDKPAPAMGGGGGGMGGMY